MAVHRLPGMSGLLDMLSIYESAVMIHSVESVAPSARQWLHVRG